MRPKSPKPVPPAPPRLPDSFVEAIRANHAGLLDDLAVQGGGLVAPPVPAAAWLGAVMLDQEAVEPGELLSGSWHIRSGDAHLTGPVAHAIRAALGGRATNDDDWPEAGQVAVGTPGCRGGQWYSRALELGCPTVVVTTHGEDAKPAEAPALADRYVELRQPDLPATLAAVISAATGTTVPRLAPGVVEGLGWNDVQLVLHPGTTAVEALDRVKRLGKVRRGQWTDAREEVSDILGVDPGNDIGKLKRGVHLVKPDPAAAKPAGDVVKRLADMAGFGSEARAWGMALADDLRDYRAGTLPWRDVDRGALLSGPPGCGKTTFARALAAECEVELVTTLYSEWGEGSSGDTISKGLTKLFKGWREKAAKAPFVLFMDEIDSMGARGGNGTGEHWFRPIINSWLAFLDGAVPRDGIVVIGATNHPDRIDPALLRPGRLDRHVPLPAPSLDAMAGIVRAHLGEGADLTDLDAAARACRGLSPAEVGLVARDARRLARRTFKRAVSADDVAFVLHAQRTRDRSPETERRVAVHEAGHAVGILALGVERLEYVDLDTRLTGSRLPEVMTRADVEARVVGLLCGMAAEATVYGVHSAGNSLDLREGTNLAASLHAAWGMGDTVSALPDGLIMGHAPTRAAVEATMSAAHRRAVALVTTHREAVERLADALQERRYLDAAEVREVVGSSPSPACG